MCALTLGRRSSPACSAPSASLEATI
ncbi:hypothetical protein LEMLEM_LOCUS10410 [Lemmus lemmus]